MESLFNPKNVAVVGVSENPSKLGSVIYQNILDSGYKKRVFPVNPKYKELFGVKSYSKVSAIPEAVDVTIVVVPAEFVPDVVKDAARARSNFIIIISAGFGETSPEGKIIEKDLASYAQKRGSRILGPNCLGILVPEHHLNLSFAIQNALPGNIAFLSQSGAVNTAVLDMANEIGLGFSHFISLGNKSDLNELDFFANWYRDPKVKVIGAYLEEIEDGRDLVNLIEKHPGKPTVILHPGKSEKAQEAISSHTGSLATSSRAVETALKQAGVIMVDSMEKLFSTLMLLSWGREPNGKNTAIVTNAGGPGIVLTDMLTQNGLQIVPLGIDTKTKLKNFLPIESSVKNPVDLVGDAKADRYEVALNIVKDDPEVHSIIVLLTPQFVTQIEDTAKVIIELTKKTTKPVIPIFIGGKYIRAGLHIMWEKKIPAFQFAEEAVFALGQLINQSSITNIKKLTEITTKKGKHNLSQYARKLEKPLPVEITQALAKEFKLDTPKEEVITTLEAAKLFAQRNGYPVVIKATSEDITHKTDVKAIYLNIKSEGDLVYNFEQLQKDLRNFTSHKYPKILIQEFVSQGEELILGLTRDGDSDVYKQTGKGFGHFVLFGKGGIYTEVYKDTNIALLPLTRDQIIETIKGTKVYSIIRGVRNQKELALDKLIEAIEALQKMAYTYPEISSLDINPIKLTENRCIILDLKVFVKE